MITVKKDGLLPPPPSPPVFSFPLDPNLLPYNPKTNQPRFQTKDATTSVIENLFE